MTLTSSGLSNSKIMLDDQEVPFTEVKGLERGFSFRVGIFPHSETKAALSLFLFPRGKVWLDAIGSCSQAGSHMENVPATKFAWKFHEGGTFCSWTPRDEVLGLGFLPFLESNDLGLPLPTLSDLARGQATLLRLSVEPPSMSWAQLVKWTIPAEVEGAIMPGHLNWTGMKTTKPLVRWTDYSKEDTPPPPVQLSKIKSDLQAMRESHSTPPPSFNPAFRIGRKEVELAPTSTWSRDHASVSMAELEELEGLPQDVQLQSMKRKLFQISRERDHDMEPPVSASLVSGQFSFEDDGYSRLEAFNLRMNLRPPNCAAQTWWQDDKLGISTRLSRPVRGSSLFMADICGSKSLNPRTVKALHDRCSVLTHRSLLYKNNGSIPMGKPSLYTFPPQPHHFILRKILLH